MAHRSAMVRRGMVFGVFDGLHQGHRYFLSKAALRCRELIVVISKSHVVRRLKSRNPRYNFQTRARTISAFNPKLVIVAGDDKLGSWSVLKKYRPDVVFLGYDQQALGVELAKRRVRCIFLRAHKPHIYKSSILHSKKNARQ